MFMADIDYSCLTGSVYERFLKEAIERSDMISISINWPQDEFSFVDREAFLSLGYAEEFLDALYKEWKQKFLLEKSIFEKETVSFLKRLEPYLLEGQNFSDKKYKYFLRSDPKVISILLEPGGIDQWGYPNYPDDLCFISDSKNWFFCENHEESATLCPKDEMDYRFWSEIGVRFQTIFDFNDLDTRLKVDFK